MTVFLIPNSCFLAFVYKIVPFFSYGYNYFYLSESVNYRGIFYSIFVFSSVPCIGYFVVIVTVFLVGYYGYCVNEYLVHVCSLGFIQE